MKAEYHKNWLITQYFWKLRSRDTHNKLINVTVCTDLSQTRKKHVIAIQRPTPTCIVRLGHIHF